MLIGGDLPHITKLLSGIHSNHHSEGLVIYIIHMHAEACEHMRISDYRHTQTMKLPTFEDNAVMSLFKITHQIMFDKGSYFAL